MHNELETALLHYLMTCWLTMYPMADWLLMRAKNTWEIAGWRDEVLSRCQALEGVLGTA